MGDEKAIKKGEAGYQPQKDLSGEAIKGYQPKQKTSEQPLHPPSGGTNVNQAGQNSQQQSNDSARKDN
jgi:hypothetical protein